MAPIYWLSAVLLCAQAQAVLLTETNFDSVVDHDGSGFFIAFYSSSCERCKKLTPIFNQEGVKTNGFGIGLVDCASAKGLALRFNITTYPTIKYISNGKVYDYDELQTLEAFSEFVVANQPSPPSAAVDPAAAISELSRRVVEQEQRLREDKFKLRQTKRAAAKLAADAGAASTVLSAQDGNDAAIAKRKPVVDVAYDNTTRNPKSPDTRQFEFVLKDNIAYPYAMSVWAILPAYVDIELATYTVTAGAGAWSGVISGSPTQVYLAGMYGFNQCSGASNAYDYFAFGITYGASTFNLTINGYTAGESTISCGSNIVNGTYCNATKYSFDCVWGSSSYVDFTTIEVC